MDKEEIVFSFDFGTGSLAEIIRCGNQILHKESWVMPHDFAETKTARDSRRMYRTRKSHKDREKFLQEVLRDSGIEILYGKQVEKINGKWCETKKGDPRLERQFAEPGDPICYTSSLLRIKLLRGEKLESWQVYKALHSAIQRRGYDPDIPWKNAISKSTKEDDPAKTLKRMSDYETELSKLSKGNPKFHYPCYFDAFKMGLVNENCKQIKDSIDCLAQSTRNQIVPRKLVEKEFEDLIASATKQYPTLAGKTKYILYGEVEAPYQSKPNTVEGVVGQKLPRFDNRIVNNCALMPRLNVCKVQPNSIVAEVVFLMNLKNMRFIRNHGLPHLTAQEITEIFNEAKQRKQLKLTKTQWKKWCKKFGGYPSLTQLEVEGAKTSGRSKFCRPALRLLKKLILSGNTPKTIHSEELAMLKGNTDPLKGLIVDDLKFLLNMGDAWEGIYIPNEKFTRLTEEKTKGMESILKLIGQQNDPIVRHRLTLIVKRLDDLAKEYGIPDRVVLELCREDFMSPIQKNEHIKRQKDRAKIRSECRQEAEKIGVTGKAAMLKVELYKQQGGIDLYTGQPIAVSDINLCVVDHIVPEAKNGPGSGINKILTTNQANSDKGKQTPYEWLSKSGGWGAYVARVKKCANSLGNKKVDLLTMPDAETLLDKYTSLAETSWIAKLVQSIVAIRFGWTMNNGKITVVTGGLTGHIRRKYKLNSLLNHDLDEDAAEIKNRNDKRHHVLDAMVISFVQKTGFVGFPNGVDRNFFAKEIGGVIPRNICVEKPVLSQTAYGARNEDGTKIIVERIEIWKLAMQPIAPGKTAFDVKYGLKIASCVRDSVIKKRVIDFLNTNPDEQSWRKFCSEFHVKHSDGSDGQSVKRVLVNSGDPKEYKDISKDGTGYYRKGLACHKGQIVYYDDNKKLCVVPIYVHDSAYKKFTSLETVEKIQLYSGCMITLKSDLQVSQYDLIIKNEANKKRLVSPNVPLKSGTFILNTIITKSKYANITTPSGTKIGAKLEVLMNAGLKPLF